ncbi:substrate-specific component FolT of folate ECF transporter [Mycoplasma sp. 1654_15]|uniref:substrate-specific component FolT of folate ECF transporter n=1 Tax=Mycoplasma sp. 1654_15 TaxID=2725994 RepID=UPI001449E0E9|nr:substrate-specific component FolT of folate ECF transporter [Mycoplasma sp. 1654_15]QJB70927.1 substrate-specific component FolT of folate ECF transporter [Mycoplasma sp. 1654_15]
MKKWSNKSIAFIAIFVSITVIMLIISVRVFPPSILPTFKYSVVGLPVKLTGFIFGPIVGFLTGVLSDLITFIFVPSLYSVFYTIYLGVTGFIPGIFFWICVKQGKKYFSNANVIKRYEGKIQLLKTKIISETREQVRADIEKKILHFEAKIKKIEGYEYDKHWLNFSWIFNSIIVAIVIISISTAIFLVPDEIVEKNKFIKKKLYGILLILFGSSSMIVFLFVTRFFKFFIKNDRYLRIAPIVAFSALHEPIGNIIVATGDVQAGVLDRFDIALIGHFLTSPIKIWINLSVIYLASSVIIPMVNNKTFYSY